MKYWIHPLKKSFIMMTSFQLKYWEYGTLVIRQYKIDMFLSMCSNIQKYFLYKNLTCFIALDHNACFGFYYPSEIWFINSSSIRLIFVNNFVILTVLNKLKLFGVVSWCWHLNIYEQIKLRALKDDFLD